MLSALFRRTLTPITLTEINIFDSTALLAAPPTTLQAICCKIPNTERLCKCVPPAPSLATQYGGVVVVQLSINVTFIVTEMGCSSYSVSLVLNELINHIYYKGGVHYVRVHSHFAVSNLIFIEREHCVLPFMKDELLRKGNER